MLWNFKLSKNWRFRYNLCNIQLIEPKFCVETDYHSAMLGIKFREDGWKGSDLTEI